jgi:hypothetical protein
MSFDKGLNKTVMGSIVLECILDALPSPGLNPLEGPTMLSCGKLGLERHFRLPTLERDRGAC